MIKKIILSLAIGALTAFTLFLNEPWLHTWLENKINNSFAQALGCSVSGRLHTFSLISPTISIENMRMMPHDKNSDWQWHCKKFILHISWWQLLAHKTIALDIEVENLLAHSGFSDGTFAIEEHIQKMIEDAPLPVAIALNCVKVQDGSFAMHDHANKREFSCSWGCVIERRGKNLDARMQLHHAAASNNGSHLLTECAGRFSCNCTENEPLKAQAELVYVSPLLSAQQCSLAASYADNALACTAAIADKSLSLDNITLTKSNDTWLFQVAGTASLSSVCGPLLGADQASGLCQLEAKGQLNNGFKVEGSLACNNICHAALPCTTDAKITFAGNMQELSGSVVIRSDQGNVAGAYAVNSTDRTICLALNNVTPLTAPFVELTVPENSCSLQCTVSDWNSKLYKRSCSGVTLLSARQLCDQCC